MFVDETLDLQFAAGRTKWGLHLPPLGGGKELGSLLMPLKKAGLELAEELEQKFCLGFIHFSKRGRRRQKTGRAPDVVGELTKAAGGPLLSGEENPDELIVKQARYHPFQKPRMADMVPSLRLGEHLVSESNDFEIHARPVVRRFHAGTAWGGMTQAVWRQKRP